MSHAPGCDARRHPRGAPPWRPQFGFIFSFTVIFPAVPERALRREAIAFFLDNDSVLNVRIFLQKFLEHYKFFQKNYGRIISLAAFGSSLPSRHTASQKQPLHRKTPIFEEPPGSSHVSSLTRINTSKPPVIIRARIGPGCTSFASLPIFAEAMDRKNAVIYPEQIAILRRESMR
jgi:hypothetical protein